MMTPQDNLLRAKINGSSEKNNKFLRIIGDHHLATSRNTPMRDDAFVLDDSTKIDKISYHFHEIMEILGLDLNDDSLKGTPRRVAKMFVKEIFSGLNPKNKPGTTRFENKFQYNQMLVEKNIKIHSYCEHHFVPIIGKANVAYIPNGKVIGLSKINRIVDYYAKRPQVQERMTEQIAQELRSILQTEDVAVLIQAEHMCVAMRGIKDSGSSTTTSSYHGKFLQHEYKNEFLTYVYNQPI
jgi:GTP cyclohydrolase I